MNYVSVGVAVVLQVAAAIYISAVYWRILVHLRRIEGSASTTAQYALLAFLACVYIPVCLFFPFWISQKFGLLDDRSDRVAAVMFGTFSMVATWVAGWRLSHRKR